MKISGIPFLIPENAFALHEFITKLAVSEIVTLARLFSPELERVEQIGDLNLPG